MEQGVHSAFLSCECLRGRVELQSLPSVRLSSPDVTHKYAAGYGNWRLAKYWPVGLLHLGAASDAMVPKRYHRRAEKPDRLQGGPRSTPEIPAAPHR